MASERITCPDCKSVLRPSKPVPDGKQVKCPRCGKPFITPGLRDETEKPSRKKPAHKNKKEKAASKKAAIKKAGGSPPAPKRPADDDEESGGVYSYITEDEKAEEDKPQIEYAPDMSIKDLRGPAQAAVVKPSNYLLLIGGLCCLSDILIFCFMFWPMVFSESPVDYRKVLENYYKDKGEKNATDKVKNIKERKELKDKEEDVVSDAEYESRKERFIWMGVFFLLLIYNAFAIIGAVKMQNLESRRWGIASSIMTLLPMGAAGLSCLIGGVFFYTVGSWVLEDMGLYYSIGLGALPYLLAIVVAVWSLRILMSEEVIEGFEYVAE